MKKTIIKRRKRVVPALRDQSPTGTTQSSNGSSASPEASPAGLAHDEQHYRYLSAEPGDHYPPMSTRISPQAAPAFAPPPVDFTSYGSTVSLPHHPAPPRLLEPERMRVPSHSPPSSQIGRRSVSPNPANPKKRTLAETASSAESVPISTLESGSNQLPPIMSSVNPSPPTRLSSISSILNHTDRRQEVSRLDFQSHHYQHHHHHHHPPPPEAAPLAHPPPPPQQPLPGVNELDGYMSERRVKLQREAEEMREALRAKERELAELGR